MELERRFMDNDVEILIVEDSLTQAMKLQHILEQHDYLVSVTHNGEEALASIKEHKPTIVISDIVMPKMDGYELCRHIKEDEDLKELPVILLTTLSDSQDVIRCLASGANDFITKPYDENFLLSRIQYILINYQLRKTTMSKMGIEIYFGGEKHLITSDRIQILDLLLSTYETVIKKNSELETTKGSLQEMNRKIELLHKIAHRLDKCKTENDVYQLTIDAAKEIISFSMYTLSIMKNNKLALKSAELPKGVNSNLIEELVRMTYATGKTYTFGSLDEIPEVCYRKLKSQKPGKLPVATTESLRSMQAGFESGLSASIGEIGVFQVISAESNPFTKDDTRLIELLLIHTAEAVRRIRLQDELRRQAIHDPLTGLYNRQYFNTIVQREGKRTKRYHRSIVFLMIDVDKFKTINDRFGYHIGDEVLQTIAFLLLESTRDTDTVVRYGGDEFLILLPETGKGEEEAVKQRITKKVADRFERHKLIDFPVTLSIGIAYWSHDSPQSIEEVLADADKRMYEDKQRKQVEKSR